MPANMTTPVVSRRRAIPNWTGGRRPDGTPVIRGVSALDSASIMQDYRAKSGLGGTPTSAEVIAGEQDRQAADKLKRSTAFEVGYENFRRNLMGQQKPAAPVDPSETRRKNLIAGGMQPNAAAAAVAQEKSAVAPVKPVAAVPVVGGAMQTAGATMTPRSNDDALARRLKDGSNANNQPGFVGTTPAMRAAQDAEAAGRVKPAAPVTTPAPSGMDAFRAATSDAGTAKELASRQASFDRSVSDKMGYTASDEQIANRAKIAKDVAANPPAIPAGTRERIAKDVEDDIPAAKKGGRMPVKMPKKMSPVEDDSPVLAGEAGPEIKMNDDGSMESITEPTLLRGGKPGVVIPNKALMAAKKQFDKPIKGKTKVRRAAIGGRIEPGNVNAFAPVQGGPAVGPMTDNQTPRMASFVPPSQGASASLFGAGTEFLRRI